MAFHDLRERAQALRKKGQSINVIVRALGAPKSTVSYWCRDIKLSDDQMRKIAVLQRNGGKKGMLLAAETKRARRIAATEYAARQGSSDVGRLNRRDRFIIGLTLYWGEGYKRGNEECGLTNTDPHIIRMFVEWLRRTYGVDRKDLILRVSINVEHKNRRDVIEKFWSKIVGVPRTQFTQASFITTKRTSGRDPAKYFGTLRVKVRRGTALRRRIMGSLSAIQEQIIS